MIKKLRSYLLFVKEWSINYCPLKAMEENRSVRKFLVKLWRRIIKKSRAYLLFVKEWSVV